MSFTVGGSTPQLTFADATVQNTAALPLTGGSVSADITVHGLTVGQGGGSVSTNTAVGASALAANTSGSQNTAIGSNALPLNTTGINNTALGFYALQQNVGGNRNTGLGVGALATNSSGSSNTGVGINGLNANSTGSFNVAVGDDALISNTTASNNTAVGYQAGYTNATGSANSFFGYQAGYTSAVSSATAGNTCIGAVTGYGLTTGTYNTFVGFGASVGGVGAGYYVTTGSKNTIIGGYNGNQGGLDIRTSSNNIVLSDGDGNPRYAQNNVGRAGITSSESDYTLSLSVPTGKQWNLLYFRKDGALPETTGTNLGYIGYDITNSRLWALNQGSGGVYLSSGGTSWTSASDERLKENLQPIENGLSKVCSLRAVIGNFIADEAKTKKPFLIAQDVALVLPEAISNTSIKDDPDQVEYLGVSYTEVIPLLVAAIKELKAEFDAYKATHP